MPDRPETTVTGRRHADPDHDVVTVETREAPAHYYRRSPCNGCPWRVDQTRKFPPEAFILSARTAYDLSDSMFGCHESYDGRAEAAGQQPLTCAGFLLRGAYHNLAVRMAASRGRIDLSKVHDGGHELHDSYTAMAVANGCDPDAPELRGCR